MKSARRRILSVLGEIVLVLALHWCLLLWLSNKEIVAKLLAAGQHVSTPTLAVAMIFVLVRIFTIVVLPGVVLVRLVGLAFHVWGPKPPSTVTEAPPAPDLP